MLLKRCLLRQEISVRTVNCRQEVLLCGGTVGSAQTLLPSRVGPQEDLKKLNVIQQMKVLTSFIYYYNIEIIRWPAILCFIYISIFLYQNIIIVAIIYHIMKIYHFTNFSNLLWHILYIPINRFQLLLTCQLDSTYK